MQVHTTRTFLCFFFLNAFVSVDVLDKGRGVTSKGALRSAAPA